MLHLTLEIDIKKLILKAHHLAQAMPNHLINGQHQNNKTMLLLDKDLKTYKEQEVLLNNLNLQRSNKINMILRVELAEAKINNYQKDSEKEWHQEEQEVSSG